MFANGLKFTPFPLKPIPKLPPNPRPQTPVGFRLQLWLLVSLGGALVWALMLYGLYDFLCRELPLGPEARAVVTQLLGDRLGLTFCLSAPLLGVLAYFAILLIANQQAQINELSHDLRAALQRQPPADELPADEPPTDEPACAPQGNASLAMQSRLVALLSHEYRTPLTTILSSAELIENYGECWNQDRIHRHLRRIRESVYGMTRLLDDIAVLGESDTGLLRFNPVALNLPQFVADLVESLNLSQGGEAAIACTFPEQLPSLEADPKLLRSILYNLLSNAIKYGEDQPIQLSLRYEDRQVIFVIADQGMGIPEGEGDRLFEPFFRADNAKKKPGSGLGLAIVQTCVTLHGGEVAIESSLGQGTTVTVKLPMNPAV